MSKHLICRKCGIQLTKRNWYNSHKKINSKICISCEIQRCSDYQKTPTGKIVNKQAHQKYDATDKGKITKYLNSKRYKQTKHGKKILSRNNKKWSKRHPEKRRSQHSLNYLFDYGDISIDDFICAICGKQPIEKHHEKYEEPFSFIPLCNYHHNLITHFKIMGEID